MDQVKKYQILLENLLEGYSQKMSAGQGALQNQVIVDTKRQHFQLFSVGWEGERHVQYPVFHFDIRDGFLLPIHWRQRGWFCFNFERPTVTAHTLSK